MCDNECWTDHRLLISKMNLRITSQRRPQGIRVPKRLNISRLKNDPVKQHLAQLLESKLPPSKADSLDNVEADWARLRDTALEVVGPTSSKHQDWFDDNNSQIQTLPKEKHRIH